MTVPKNEGCIINLTSVRLSVTDAQNVSPGEIGFQ